MIDRHTNLDHPFDHGRRSRLTGGGDGGSQRAESGRLFRLSGRRPGRGARQGRLCGPCHPAGRHHHHRRQRPGASASAGRDQGPGRHTLAQSPRRARRHAGEPGNLSDRPAGSEFPRRAGGLRRQQALIAAADHDLRDPRHAPLHLRRPLCLRLARARRLSRQRGRDHRLQRSGAAAGGGALVDAGAMDRRRRDPDLEGHGPSLSPSHALRRPALRELLARRLRDPRHRRHEQAEIRVRPRLEPAVPVADPHRACRCRSRCAAGA